MSAPRYDPVAELVRLLSEVGAQVTFYGQPIPAEALLTIRDMYAEEVANTLIGILRVDRHAGAVTSAKDEAVADSIDAKPIVNKRTVVRPARGIFPPSESWWTRAKSREEFDALVQRESPRMRLSQLGCLPGSMRE